MAILLKNTLKSRIERNHDMQMIEKKTKSRSQKSIRPWQKSIQDVKLLHFISSLVGHAQISILHEKYGHVRFNQN